MMKFGCFESKNNSNSIRKDTSLERKDMVSHMTLDQLNPGYSAILSVIGGEGALRRHLLDMGLTPNTKVTVRKVAPMGDPIELFLRGYVLTIRREDAANITVVSVEKG